MYWWYKDIFVERNNNNEFEYPNNINIGNEKADAPRLAFVKTGVSKLLNKMNQTLRLKQTAQQMKHLRDHQLDDIGLSRNDLNMMSKGNYLKKTKENSGKNYFRKQTELAIVKNNKKSEQAAATPEFRQAA